MVTTEELTQDIKAAWEEVFALAKGRDRGGREWTMCIPVHPTDSDEVLARGLRAGETALARATAAEEREQALRAVVEWYADAGHFDRIRPSPGVWVHGLPENPGWSWVPDEGARARTALAALDGSERGE